MSILINNKYKIIEHIGTGKFGKVYKGQNIRTKEYVAIKAASNNCRLMTREVNYLNYLARCGVKRVPSIYYYGQIGSTQAKCIAMTFFSCDLKTFLSQYESKQLTYVFLNECIDILRHVHQHNVLHRDIKLDNFMIKDDKVFLIDFGFAYTIDPEDEISHCENIIGSPKYISYFVHCGMNYSYRDDLLSLGYVFLFLLNQYLPWENIPQINDPHYAITNISHPSNLVRKEQKSKTNVLLLCDDAVKPFFEHCYALDVFEVAFYDKLHVKF